MANATQVVLENNFSRQIAIAREITFQFVQSSAAGYFSDRFHFGLLSESGRSPGFSWIIFPGVEGCQGALAKIACMVDEGSKAKIGEMDGRRPFDSSPGVGRGSRSGFRPAGVVEGATGLPVGLHLIQPVVQIILVGELAGWTLSAAILAA
jgi:hypothetical protein